MSHNRYTIPSRVPHALAREAGPPQTPAKYSPTGDHSDAVGTQLLWGDDRSFHAPEYADMQGKR
jgi:hypothetical protein